MAGTTRYKNDWQKKNLDRIGLTVPKGRKEQIQGHASAHGESINGFISRAISETMDWDRTFEENKEEIASLAQKYSVDIDMNDPTFRKIVQALAVLESQVPGIENSYFYKLDLQTHVSGVVITEGIPSSLV